MRLIDADAYKDDMCQNCISKLKYGETFCPCGRVLDIDYFPTAYDVAKVCGELWSESRQNVGMDTRLSTIVAIDIVKRGGE